MKATLPLFAALALTSGCAANGSNADGDADADGDIDADAGTRDGGGDSDADADADADADGDLEFECLSMGAGACDVVETSAGGFFPSGFEVGFSAGHSCARLSSGELACWGHNGSGQLGDGTMFQRSAPVGVQERAAASKVSAGGAHSCAIGPDDSARCWGWNAYGQLGNGSTADSAAPVTVLTLAEVQNVATGGRHTCATLLDGSVACWGDNDHGQLGDADADDGSCAGGRMCSSDPVHVPGLDDAVVEVALGDHHTCARTALSSVLCWGANESGQLGDGTLQDRATPAVVSLPSDVLHVAAGGSQTCALVSGGHVRCWGAVGFDRDFMPDRRDPCTDGVGDPAPCVVAPGPAVEGLIDPTAIAVGKEHACALVTGGRVTCWGGNRAGQLGTGDLEDSPVMADGTFRAVDALGVSAADGVAAGRLHTCAWRTDGIWCWGDDERGQVGVDPADAGGQCMSRVDTPYPCQPTPRLIDGLPR